MCPRLYLLSAQVVFTNPYLVHLVRYFPEASFRPKLQMAFEVPAGSCPRRVAVERRRRQFLAQDIGQLLQQAGVDLDSLTPDLSSPTDPCAERPPPPRLLPNVPPLDEVRRGTTIAGGEQLVTSEREARSEFLLIYTKNLSMSGPPAVVTLLRGLYLWNRKPD